MFYCDFIKKIMSVRFYLLVYCLVFLTSSLFAVGNKVNICETDFRPNPDNFVIRPVIYLDNDGNVKYQKIYSISEHGGNYREHNVLGAVGDNKLIAYDQNGHLRLFNIEGKTIRINEYIHASSYTCGKEYDNRIIAYEKSSSNNYSLSSKYLENIRQIVIVEDVQKWSDAEARAFILYNKDPETGEPGTLYCFPVKYKSNYSFNPTGQTDIVIDTTTRTRCYPAIPAANKICTNIIAIDVICPLSLGIKDDKISDTVTPKVVLYKYDPSLDCGKGLYNPEKRKRDILGPNSICVWQADADFKYTNGGQPGSYFQGPINLTTNHYIASWGTGGTLGIYDGKLSYVLPFFTGGRPQVHSDFRRWKHEYIHIGISLIIDSYYLPVNNIKDISKNHFFSKDNFGTRGIHLQMITHWINDRNPINNIDDNSHSMDKFRREYYLTYPFSDFKEKCVIGTITKSLGDKKLIAWAPSYRMGGPGTRHTGSGKRSVDYYYYYTITDLYCPTDKLPMLFALSKKDLEDLNNNLKGEYLDNAKTSPRSIEEAIKQHVKIDGIIWGLPFFLVDSGWEDNDSPLSGFSTPDVRLTTEYEYTDSRSRTDIKTNDQNVSVGFKWTNQVNSNMGNVDIGVDWSREFRKENGIKYTDIKNRSMSHTFDGKNKYLKEDGFGFNGTVYYYTGPINLSSLGLLVTQNNQPITDIDGNKVVMLTGTSDTISPKKDGIYEIPEPKNVDFNLSKPNKKSVSDDNSALSEGLMPAPPFALFPEPKNDFEHSPAKKDKEFLSRLREGMNHTYNNYYESDYNQVAIALYDYSNKNNGIILLLDCNYPVNRSVSLTDSKTAIKEIKHTESQINKVGGHTNLHYYGYVNIDFSFGFGWTNTDIKQKFEKNEKGFNIPSCQYNYNNYYFDYCQVYIDTKELKKWLYDNRNNSSLIITKYDTDKHNPKKENIIYKPFNEDKGILNKPPFIPTWCWYRNEAFWMMFPVIRSKHINTANPNELHQNNTHVTNI